ncbi:MAG: hypothetical protein M3217_01335, partial [Actinomycetota bacterium]|nr:hypothetical protein [Actinomycetota bacterium]
RAAARELVPEAVLATWALLAASVVVGLAPGMLGGSDTGLGGTGGVALLQATALAAGAGAVAAARRWDLAPQQGPVHSAADPLPVETLAVPVVWAVGALGVGTAVAATSLTVWGLRVGFL